MKNPADIYGRDPETPINIPKIAKKAAIGWLVPFVLGLICWGFLALAKSQADGLYERKEDAVAVQKVLSARVDHDEDEINTLKDKLESMDKKLDRMEYILEFTQGKALSPKMKDQQ